MCQLNAQRAIQNGTVGDAEQTTETLKSKNYRGRKKPSSTQVENILLSPPPPFLVSMRSEQPTA